MTSPPSSPQPLAASAGPVFRLDPSPTFEAVVPVPVPGYPGRTAPLALTFRALGRRALLDWRLAPRQAADTGGEVPTDGEWLAEIIQAWQVVDEADQPVPFDADALDRLLDQYHGAAQVIFETYLEALAGARTKNG